MGIDAPITAPHNGLDPLSGVTNSDYQHHAALTFVMNEGRGKGYTNAELREFLSMLGYISYAAPSRETRSLKNIVIRKNNGYLKKIGKG